ncbi:TadE family protein [Gleimia hominis]|uniref:TadE family protein n=1 Tax=Gleimia hominis TaxID=595468 RepID=UPI0018EA95E6|nr:TadE family protein [Gleimia hominis]WIK64745.1 pilus assembly protein [Gleimia hominis]
MRPPLAGQERAGAEAGSQVVSHVLVQTFVVLIVLTIMQIAFAVHVRNMSLDAASEGARRATFENATDKDAMERAQALLDKSVGADRGARVIISRAEEAYGTKITVRISARLPVLGPFGPDHMQTVEASSWLNPRETSGGRPGKKPSPATASTPSTFPSSNPEPPNPSADTPTEQDPPDTERGSGTDGGGR